ILLYSDRPCAPPALPSFPSRPSSDLVKILSAIIAPLPALDQASFNAIPSPQSLRHPGQTRAAPLAMPFPALLVCTSSYDIAFRRSEEHTSELQSRVDLVCRLVLEKKN